MERIQATFQEMRKTNYVWVKNCEIGKIWAYNENIYVIAGPKPIGKYAGELYAKKIVGLYKKA